VSALALTYEQAARIVRDGEAVKDKSYRKYPIGQEWGRFLRARKEAVSDLLVDITPELSSSGWTQPRLKP
jgi:hypothetical protein